MKKFLIVLTVLLFAIFPKESFAQKPEIIENKYKAKIVSIKYEDLEEQKITIYELEIFDTEKKGEKIEVQTAPEDKSIEVKNYKVGDKVIVLSNETEEYQQYFITDHIRTDSILSLVIFFIILTIIIGRKLGIQSLLGLGLTVIVLLTIIIPVIEKGGSILPTAFASGCLIAIISIYLSHGFNKKSTIALIGTLASIVITLIFAVLFTNLFKLTGYSSEESMFLLDFDGISINMKNLLIASLIFGGIGILDDVTVSQVSVTKEVFEANPKVEASVLYKKAMNVGRDHISSMVNTLFLAYASASLPLIILLRLENISLGEIINNEVIAEEILRTLVGSIGLILAVPITTALAVYFYKRKDLYTVVSSSE